MGKYIDQRVADKLGILKKNIIQNGTTTVVYGETHMDVNKCNQITLKLADTAGILGSIAYDKIVTRGVSKLHPDDKYDEKTGVKIASRKAELKGRIKYYNKLADAYDLLAEALDLLDAEMSKEEQRLSVVVSDLNSEGSETELEHAQA